MRALFGLLLMAGCSIGAGSTSAIDRAVWVVATYPGNYSTYNVSGSENTSSLEVPFAQLTQLSPYYGGGYPFDTNNALKFNFYFNVDKQTLFGSSVCQGTTAKFECTIMLPRGTALVPCALVVSPSAPAVYLFVALQLDVGESTCIVADKT